MRAVVVVSVVLVWGGACVCGPSVPPGPGDAALPHEDAGAEDAGEGADAGGADAGTRDAGADAGRADAGAVGDAGACLADGGYLSGVSGGACFFVPPCLGSDGFFDPTFGSGGNAFSPFGSAVGRPTVLADGRIVAGFSRPSGVSLSRFSADGVFDSSFGVAGGVSLAPLNLRGLAAQRDGKVLALLHDGSSQKIVRFDDTGAVDPSFTSIALPCDAIQLAPQDDGRVLVAGRASSGACVLRLQSDGSLDQSFGLTWPVIIPELPTSLPFMVSRILPLSRGRVFVFGTAQNSDLPDLFALRLEADGGRDSSFGGSGLIGIDFGGSETSGDAALLPDGGVILVGWEKHDPYYQPSVLLVRLAEDGSFDPAFNGSGWTSTPQAGELWGFAVFPLKDDRLLVVAPSKYFDRTRLLRFGPSGCLDPSFHGTGYTSPLEAMQFYTEVAVAQPDGKIILVGGRSPNDRPLIRYVP